MTTKKSATTLSNWAPHSRPVQGFIKNGEYSISDTTLILAGPAQIDDVVGLDLDTAQDTAQLSVPGTDNVFYPIGVVSRFIKSEGKQPIPILEIGSSIIQLIPTKATGALSLDKVLLDAPTLLRALNAIYSGDGEGVSFGSLMSTYDPSQTDLSLNSDPGRDNYFLTLFSDLYNFPIGLLLILADQKRQMRSGLYFENALISGHTFSVDSGTNLILESARITYSRAIPARVSTAQAPTSATA
jgi:hypothetical protein